MIKCNVMLLNTKFRYFRNVARVFNVYYFVYYNICAVTQSTSKNMSLIDDTIYPRRWH